MYILVFIFLFLSYNRFSQLHLHVAFCYQVFILLTLGKWDLPTYIQVLIHYFRFAFGKTMIRLSMLYDRDCGIGEIQFTKRHNFKLLPLTLTKTGLNTCCKPCSKSCLKLVLIQPDRREDPNKNRRRAFERHQTASTEEGSGQASSNSQSTGTRLQFSYLLRC